MKPSFTPLIRASTTLHNTFSKRVSSKAEEMAFLDVFNKIMNNPNKSTSTENKAMQLIFEESMASLKNAEPRKRTFTDSTDVYGRFSFNRDVSNRILKDLEKTNKLEQALKPTFNKMNALDTNLEVVEYLTSVIHNFEQSLSTDSFKPTKFSNELLDNISQSQTLNELTFPLILLKGLNLLSNDFNSKQESLNVIQLLKSQNLKVFFFGLTIDILNLNLKIHWDLYKDLNRINSIIDEIKINGIQPNVSTLQTLKKISTDYHHQIDPNLHLLDDQIMNSVYNRRDEMELFQIDQYISDLVEVLK